MRRYEDDPIKAKSRIEIYRFADRHLPKDRSEATAVYLASDNSEETQLLDRLGISRDRRVILERDYGKIRQVEQANPGIRVIHGSTSDFLKGEEVKKYAPLWYAGLDYECRVNDGIRSDIQTLGMGLLLDGGVVYTNLVGNRENQGEKEDYVDRFLSSRFVTGLSESEYLATLQQLFGPDINIEDVFDSLIHEVGSQMTPGKLDYEEIGTAVQRKLARYLPPERLDEVRSHALYDQVANLLLARHDPLFIFEDDDDPGKIIRDRIFFADRYAPGADKICFDVTGEKVGTVETSFTEGRIFANKLETVVSKLLDINAIDETADRFFAVMTGDLRPDEVNFGTPEQSNRQTLLLSPLEKNARRYFKKGGLSLLAHVLSELYTFGYVVTNHNPFKYTSNRNTKMLLDLMKVRKINPAANDFFDELSESDIGIWYTRDRPYLARMNASGRFSPRVLKRELEKQSEWNIRRLEKRMGFLRFLEPQYAGYANRVDLGSSFKQPLTTFLARKYVLDGLTNEEIAERCQVGDGRKLAAVRANVTRGRITKPEQKEERPAKAEPESLPGSKYLISRAEYKRLPDDHRLRLDYFREEVLDELSYRRQGTLRKAFHESGIRDRVNPNGNPTRWYAFWDDVELAVRDNRRISSGLIDELYRNAMRPNNDSRPVPRHEGPPILTDAMKEHVRALVANGNDPDDVWEDYKGNFASRQQFGAVIAWGSGKLKDKKK
ncbi:MAG: hypothetical protein KKA90_04025 [Nanoarchaeota archaeon]|nr:hypothetical protein [Nanoarchaeota archaeon]